MKKSVRTLVAFFFVLLFSLSLSSAAFAQISIPSATSDFYVNDFAGVFSDDEKSQLMNKAVALSDTYDGIQVVVTTVETLGGNTIENYAFEMYNRYGIGKDDLGLLILLSTGDRKIRVEVGKAMEAYITDSKAGRFIDKYAIPSLRENKFNEGLINLQEALISEIAKQLNPIKQSVSTTNPPTPISRSLEASDKQSTESKEDKVVTIIFILIPVILVAIICILITLVIKKNNKIQKLEEENTSLTRDWRNEVSGYNALIEKHKKLQAKADSLQEYEDKLTNELNSSKQYHKVEVKRLNTQIDNLREEIRTTSEASSLCISNYEDWKKRALLLHPTLDKEIEDLINEEIKQKNMKKAKEVDVKISDVIKMSPARGNLSYFSYALTAYKSLTPEQKAFVTSNIQKLQQLYDTSSEAQRKYEKEQEEERIRRETEKAKKSANDALQSIRSITSEISTGTAENLADLQKARKIYDNLDRKARQYFHSPVLHVLDRLIQEAEADYKQQEEIKQDKQRAASAMSTISRTISYISRGHSNDLSKLITAKRSYENLDSRARQYVDKSTIDKLNHLIKEAKRDQEEEEARQRRARSSSYSSYSSSSSYHHHSSGGGFGGFGGHSGGGGASRGF